MFSASAFHAVVSGRRGGVGAAALRGVLRAGEVPYSLAVRWRNRRYDGGHAVVRSVDVTVVSVGNLTLGGTGKTPLVKWIVRWASRRGIRPAIVSRGYGAANGQPNDEAMELAQALPGVAHLQKPDRVAAATQAVVDGAELIVLDDGFQHRRLARNLDIVLLDALEPFGFEHVFPRGTLREPVSGLARAGVVCLSRADLVTADQRAAVRRRVNELAPGATWCEVAHTPCGLIAADGREEPLAGLRGRRAVAFCGLGNPAGFRRSLESTGCEIAAWREFPDHHQYAAADVAELEKLAVDTGGELLVCTHKDLVKIGRGDLGGRPLWAMTVEIRFLTGQEHLEEALVRQLAARK